MGMLTFLEKMLLGNGVKLQQATEKEGTTNKEGTKERKEGSTTETSALDALRPQISHVNMTVSLHLFRQREHQH